MKLHSKSCLLIGVTMTTLIILFKCTRTKFFRLAKRKSTSKSSYRYKKTYKYEGSSTRKSALDTIRKSQWSPVTLLSCYPSLQALPLQRLHNVKRSCPIWLLLGLRNFAANMGVVALTAVQFAAVVHDCYYLDPIFLWTDAALTVNGKTTGCCGIEYKWLNTYTGYRSWLDCLALTAAPLTASQGTAPTRWRGDCWLY